MSDLKQIEALRRAAQKIDELQSMSQQNTALKEENKRLKEALGDVIEQVDILFNAAMETVYEGDDPKFSWDPVNAARGLLKEE